jgi:hypothetical protein
MVFSVAESHRRPVYAIAWNLVDASLADTFASVGANRVSVYRLALPEIAAADDPPVAAAAAPMKDGKRLGGQSGASPAECTLQQAYCDQDPDENFYCCAWGVRVGPDGATATSVLAVAGALFQIKLLDLCAGQVACVLRGHGGAVNELQFHPRERALLVSAAADESVRLWHVGVGHCLATFAGHSGHRDAVVSLDVRLDGRALVTGAIDGAIKLWALDAPPLQRRVMAANEAAASASAAIASAVDADEAAAAELGMADGRVAAGPASLPSAPRHLRPRSLRCRVEPLLLGRLRALGGGGGSLSRDGRTDRAVAAAAHARSGACRGDGGHGCRGSSSRGRGS